MLIIVWCRSKIAPTIISGDLLSALKHPIYPLSIREPQNEYDLAHGVSPEATAQRTRDFMLFNEYTDIFEHSYAPMYDFESPLFFLPSNCKKDKSFVLPARESPIIAIIGDLADPMNSAAHDYLLKLHRWQDNHFYTGIDWQLVSFDDEAAFNAYVSAEDYLTDAREGVCFGFQMEKRATNDYAATLFFDDQAALLGASGIGIPVQFDYSWNPYTNVPQIRDFNIYSRDGYSFLQNLFANLVLKDISGDEVSDPYISMMAIPFKSNDVQKDPFQYVAENFVPGFLFLVYILPVYNVVFLIVKEKESKTKESMRMMGMSDAPYWLSWFVFYTFISTLVATISWSVLLINFVQPNSYLFVWLWFWVYGEAIFGVIVFIQSMFSKSKFAGIIASIVYFTMCFFYFPVWGVKPPKMKKWFSLLPQVAIFQLSEVFAPLYGSGLGVNEGTVDLYIYNYMFSEGLIMMSIGGFLFFLLGIYLDAILPKEYGQRQHPCFMFMPSSYSCCGKKKQSRGNIVDGLLANGDSDQFEREALPADAYEAPAPEMTRLEPSGAFLSIQNLQKKYGNGFQAVKGLNMKMYKNQIFALLGQNGAGKTTTISMLTGLIQPSAGEASVFDTDMFNAISKVRTFMGVCPQHDVLFDLLTPEEHLSIFYDFKGGDPALKEQEIKDLVRDVGLTVDAKKESRSLSGGNKRKLSVAIAICGQSKLILLDEPTAGMDLSARRQMWDMLKNYRRDKIIILTTHYMDEADVLGDRIGIMAKGKLMCLGTSLFLKNRFGSGYKLTMVKKQKARNTLVEPFLKSSLGADMVTLLQEVSSEITFGVARSAAPKFKEFFSTFDNEYEALGIDSYGISITTLEEVFININKENGITDDVAAGEMQLAQEEFQPLLGGSEISKKAAALNLTKETNTTQNSNFISLYNDSGDQGQQSEALTQRLIHDSSFWANFKALSAKRFNIWKRDYGALGCEIFIPSVLVLIGCLTTKISWYSESFPKLLSTDLYPAPQRILLNQNTVIDAGLSSTVSPQTLFAHLPNSSSTFEPIYTDTNDFSTFYDQTFDLRQQEPTMPYHFGSYMVYRADSAANQFEICTFLNLTSSDVMALYPQFIYQSILSTVAGTDDFVFDVTTSPMPPLYVFKERSAAGNAFDFTFMVAIGLALIPTVMVSFILKEREENQKHMQVISGMSLPAYWISNYCADIVKAYIPVLLIVGISVLFNCNYPGVALLFFIYPFSLVPFTYATSFLFSDETSAQVTTLFYHFCICGIIGPLGFFFQTVPQLFSVGDSMKWWLCALCPSYCVTNSILWSSSSDYILDERSARADFPQLGTGLWAWDGLGGDALFILLHFVVDSLILILIELDIFARCKSYTFRRIPPPKEQTALDSDVLNEEERVRLETNEVIRVAGFRKAYTTLLGEPSLAVERISFGLDFGECFCLLGVNGAGKSSTFKSLTADTTPTAGAITIQGYKIPQQFPAARKLIGYCPQKDALFPLMSVEEHLYFYAKIKGIPYEMQARVIEKAIAELSLQDQRTKLAGTLSGGNRRKLSVGLATIGNPPIILLDEPSAGMDPEARRFMWSVVAKISQRDKNSAVILTTHSMEEAEALSTKMGIMVRGGIFKCFGSSQHIKNKFGTGYEVEIKIRKPSFADLEQLSEELGYTRDLDQRAKISGLFVQCVSKVDKIVIEQIRKNGLGSDLAMEAEANQESIRLRNLVNYFFVMERGMILIKLLAELFPQVDLIEQCSDFFKFRVPRNGKTIGWLFGQLQDKKDQCGISEYSVSQTSLEQIFAQFANMNIESQICLTFKLDTVGMLKLLNPDKKLDCSIHSLNDFNQNSFSQEESKNESPSGFPSLL